VRKEGRKDAGMEEARNGREERERKGKRARWSQLQQASSRAEEVEGGDVGRLRTDIFEETLSWIELSRRIRREQDKEARTISSFIANSAAPIDCTGMHQGGWRRCHHRGLHQHLRAPNEHRL
jgi:hypothetical protein